MELGRKDIFLSGSFWGGGLNVGTASFLAQLVIGKLDSDSQSVFIHFLVRKY